MRLITLRQIILHLGIVTCLLPTVVVMPALAQQNSSNRAEFPGRRIGGGTRGECLMSNQPLVALNPANNLGVTASDRPAVYFSVPRLDESYPVEFVLRDADGKPVYETALKVGKTKEIVGVHLPQNVLRVGQDYQWYFSVVCDAEDRSQNMVLSGWLRRVLPQSIKESGSSLEARLNLVKSYQETGLWNDAIASLVELQQTHPNNNKVLLQWEKLLQQLELKLNVRPSFASQL